MLLQFLPKNLVQVIFRKQIRSSFSTIAEAHDEIIQLAEKLKAPIAYTYKGKMAIQYNNPFEVGLTGLLGIPSAYRAMHECELLLLLWTDFPYTPFMPVQNKIVQID